MKKEGKYKITYGGWYQRTTLHLSEIHGFFAYGKSNLPLSKKKLAELHKGLDLKSVSREASEVGNMEYLKAITKGGIEIRYYEDGLYILELDTDDIRKTEKLLEGYFNRAFHPAIEYLFSLGAPTPKILANIPIEHPTVVALIDSKHREFNVPKEFGEVYGKITSGQITVYKTVGYIFVVASPTSRRKLIALSEVEIFFREFKDQLERYLSIHRSLWEQIQSIKEREYVKGDEVIRLRNSLEGYQKTISLISNRISQMDTYAKTRASIAKYIGIEESLQTLFQYKFESLFDTLAYIDEIWEMTDDYVAAAIKVVEAIEERSTDKSIKSIQTLGSIGVVAGIIGYVTRDQLPALSFTSLGAAYFIGMLALAFIVNWAVNKFYKRSKYEIKFIERAKL